MPSIQIECDIRVIITCEGREVIYMALQEEELLVIAADIAKAAMTCETKSASDIFHRPQEIVKFIDEVYEGLKATNDRID